MNGNFEKNWKNIKKWNRPIITDNKAAAFFFINKYNNRTFPKGKKIRLFKVMLKI
jgi:hypothetical protein